MPNQSKIAILILAAGGSSRMGSPKQLLKWKDSNLLNHCISKAIKLKAKNVFVVLGANAELIIPEIDQKEVRIVINQDWDKGLGSSISEGVNHIVKSKLEIDGLLIMLTDQPIIVYDHYLKLIKDFSSGDKAIIATKYNDNKLGVPALFDEIYFKDLIDLNSDFGAKQLFIKYSKNVQSIVNHNAVYDLDNLEQYEDLYRDNHL